MTGDNTSSSRLLPLALSVAAMLLLGAGALTAKDRSRDKLLWISDIHFDPMADPSLASDLAAADPDRWEAILQRSTLTAFSQYGQDTNWWLLRSALDQMHSALPWPALVIYTGDVVAHGFRPAYLKATGDSDWDHYRAFVLKTITFVALQLHKRFRKTQILLTPGNNDDDCGITPLSLMALSCTIAPRWCASLPWQTLRSSTIGPLWAATARHTQRLLTFESCR